CALPISALSTTTTIYDNKNQKAGSLYSQKGSFVELNQISPYIQDAVIATEDRTFYKNPGFSVKGMARAAISSLIHRGIVGGGSTLTQQQYLRSEEHTSELQSRFDLVCRLLLEKKKKSIIDVVQLIKTVN